MDEFAQLFGVFVAAVDGGLQPFAGNGCVLRYAGAGVVQAGEVVLGGGVALGGGLGKPAGGLFGVGLYAFAVVVHHTEVGLCFGVAVAGRQRIVGERAFKVLRYAYAVVQGETGLVVAFDGLLEFEDFLVVGGVGNVAAGVEHQQALHGNEAAVFDGVFVIAARFFQVGMDTEAVLADVAQEAECVGMVVPGGFGGKKGGFFIVARQVGADEVLFGQKGAGVVVFLSGGFVDPFDAFFRVGRQVLPFQQEFAQFGLGGGYAGIGGDT